MKAGALSHGLTYTQLSVMWHMFLYWNDLVSVTHKFITIIPKSNVWGFFLYLSLCI